MRPWGDSAAPRGNGTTMETDGRARRTSNIEAGAGQDAAVAAVAHQVVPRLLPGAVEAGEGHAERGGAEGGVGGGGQTAAVQRPVQVLRAQAEVGADGAGGGQGGTDEQRGVLRGDHCRVCGRRQREGERCAAQHGTVGTSLRARFGAGLRFFPPIGKQQWKVWGRFGFLAFCCSAVRTAELSTLTQTMCCCCTALRGWGGAHIPYRDPPATIALASLLWEESKPRTERLQSTAGCSHVPQGKTTRG